MGNIGLFDIDYNNKTSEIGYWLGVEFTRNGYMTEAMQILEKYAFTELQLNRIQIKCDALNNASESLAQKCGYQLEGKLRATDYKKTDNIFRDTLYFSKLASEYFNKK